MKDIKIVEANTEEITKLWKTKSEIESQLSALKEEHTAICSKLDTLLPIDLQSDNTQLFDVDGIIIKGLPRINRSVNSDLLSDLLTNNEKASALADVFKKKYELKDAQWKALKKEEKAIFASCVTEKNGKTEYKEK